MKNKEGWDGKMRVDRKAVLANPEALEDSGNSESDAPNEVEQIAADEGKLSPQLSFERGHHGQGQCTDNNIDLLSDEDEEVEVCWRLLLASHVALCFELLADAHLGLLGN